MANVNNLQFFKTRLQDGTFNESNNLALALMTKPEISNTLAYAFGDKYYLNYLTAGSGRVSKEYKYIGNVQYQWPLMGDLIKPIAIVENFGADAGQNFVPFSVKLAERYFWKGCVVTTESNFQLVVKEDPTQDGNDWIYTFQLNTGDQSAFVPSIELEAGKLLSMGYTAFPEGSRKAGAFEAYPMWFQNQLTILRNSFGITGSADSDVMVLPINREGYKPSYLWMEASIYQKMLQWNKQLEYYRWYGEYNRTPDGEVYITGENNRPILTGAGVLSQISDSTTRFYSNLTTDFMADFLIDLQLASKYSEGRKLVMFTGAAGIKRFNDAILKEYKNFNMLDTTFVSRNGLDLKFDKSRWRTYGDILGTELTVVHVDLFDDRNQFTKVDPETGLPVESSRMVFLDLGDYGGEPNISLVAKGADGRNRSMQMWYEGGSTVPGGSQPAPDYKQSIEMFRALRSNDYDGYMCHVLSEHGIKVTNPLACGQLIFQTQ